MVIFYKKNGFSLIELMVVISIIATLTAILLPNFMGARERANDAQKIQDLNSIKNALRMYYNDNQSYPVGSGITNIGVQLSGYGVDSGIGFTYYGTNNGEGFQLCSYLESGQGTDDTNSQTKCGIGTTVVCGKGGLTDKLFVVCAK